jgi:hypothetical protein
MRGVQKTLSRSRLDSRRGINQSARWTSRSLRRFSQRPACRIENAPRKEQGSRNDSSTHQETRIQNEETTNSRSEASQIFSNEGKLASADETNDLSPSASKEAGGAMSQRLAQMTEDSLVTGGSSARRAVADAAGTGFDEDLRRRLEEKISSANLARSEHPQAFATINLPESAGRGTRDIAGAKPWTGDEAVEDTALRMLTDAHKPLRGGGRGQPVRVVLSKPKSKRISAGTRIAEAREQASKYSDLKEAGMDKEEREEYLKELHARFQPAARHMPATLTGLASLANERIEEAIARGQFKNLPRGKALERDYNTSSQFLDTTEYLLNRIIARQEIVPPWIEKQQEVASAIRVFRVRLRNDWRRHAARMIASKGGSLENKVQRAKEYAAAELEMVGTAASDGHIDDPEHRSQLSLSGQLDQRQDSDSTNLPNSDDKEPVAQVDTDGKRLRKRYPYRDPEWEAAEHAFHTVSIKTLNNLTRSYNLMAPELAKKPYFNLERELKACFAEVAPQLPGEIRERALTPNLRTRSVTGSSGLPLLGRFEKDKAAVHDEDIRKKGYGWREFWKDMWGTGTVSR